MPLQPIEGGRQVVSFRVGIHFNHTIHIVHRDASVRREIEIQPMITVADKLSALIIRHIHISLKHELQKWAHPFPFAPVWIGFFNEVKRTTGAE